MIRSTPPPWRPTCSPSRKAGKAHLTGHSLGGALAQRMAVEHPDVAASVVTFRPPGIGKKAKDSKLDPKEVTHYIGGGDFVHLFGGDHDDGSVIQANGLAMDSALEAGTLGAGVGHGDGIFESPEFAQTLDSVGQKDEAFTGIDSRGLTELEQHPAGQLVPMGLEVLRLIVAGRTETARVLLSELVFMAREAFEAVLEVGEYALELAIEKGKKTLKLVVDGVEFVRDAVGDAKDAVTGAVDSLVGEVAELLKDIGELVEDGAQHGQVGILLLR